MRHSKNLTYILQLFLVLLLSIFTAQIAFPQDSGSSKSTDQNPIQESQKVHLTYGNIPKSASIKRGTRVVFSGRKLSDLTGSRLEIKTNGEVIQTADADKDWSLSWDTKSELKDANFLSIGLIEPGNKTAKVASIVINLFDKCPVAISRIKYNNDEPWQITVKVSSPDDIEIEKMSLVFDEKNLDVLIDPDHSAVVSVEKQKPGTHAIKLRIELKSGGEMFSEPMTFKIPTIIDVRMNSENPIVNLREVGNPTTLPVDINPIGENKIKSINAYIDNKFYAKVDKKPFAYIIDGSDLYAGSYRFWISATDETNRVYYSEEKNFEVLRNGKREYRVYLASLMPILTGFQDREDEIHKSEIEFLDEYANMMKATEYLDWNDSMNNLHQICNKIIKLHNNFNTEIYSKSTSIKIPYGVNKELHPSILKSIRLISDSKLLIQQGWRHQDRVLDMMVWNNTTKRWVYNTSKLVSAAMSTRGSGTMKNKPDYDLEAQQNRKTGFSMLEQLINKLPD